MANLLGNSNSYFSSHQLVNIVSNNNNWSSISLDVFAALRKNQVVSVCPDCNDVTTPNPHKLKCENCDKEYEGELSLKKVKIAGEEIVVSVQEGKCSSCGCHNMDRKTAEIVCKKCGCDVTLYLPKHRAEEQYMITDHAQPPSGSGTATDWIPYVTIGTPTFYDVTSTSASTVYTCLSA